MTMPGRLLFSFWPFPPGEAEPAHGYFLRLVKGQGETSLRNFNIWNMIETETPFPTRMLEDIEAHPMPKAWLEKLRANTPVKHGNFYDLRGHRLRYLQVSLRPRSWCPGCMHEESYHRSWWDIESINDCPFHGIPLESSLDDEGGVTWRWLDFQHTSNGKEFGRKIDRVGDTSSYARYVLGRLGWADAVPCKLLDEFELADVIQFCEIVGQSLESSLRRKTSAKTALSAKIGYNALSKDRGLFAEALRSKLRSYVDEPTGETIRDYFPAIQGRFSELSKGPRDLLRRALREAYVAEKEGLTRNILDSDFDVHFVTTIDLGRELGIGPQTVRRIAQALGVLQSSREHGIIPASARQAIGEFRDQLLTRFQAFKRLGLRQGTVNHLVRAGYLTVFRSARVGQRTGGLFSPLEIDAIIRRLDALPTTGIERRACTFNGYHVNYKLHAGDLAVACLRGDMTVISRIPNKRGFMRLVLEGRPDGDPPRSRVAMPPFSGRGTVTMFEAEVLLNLTAPAIRDLIASSQLSVVRHHAKLTLLSRDSMLDFGAAHAKVSDYATCLMLEPGQLEARLLASGAKPVAMLGRGGIGSGVYNRGDILRLLDLKTDPVLFDDPRVVVFWNLFLSAAAERCPSLIIPSRLPPHELFVRDKKRTVRAVFNQRPRSAEITCAISAVRVPVSRVIIHLNADDHEISSRRLMDAIQRSMDHGLENFTTKRRAVLQKAVERRASARTAKVDSR